MTLRLKDGARYFLAYDAENRLASVSGTASASFVYNGDGQRVSATIDTTITTYIGGYFEWQGGAGTSYYFAGAQRIAMRTGTDLKYLLGDHLSSTSVTALASGAFDTETRYYPWGGVRWSSGASPTDYMFTGQQEVGYIGLYFYNSRFYDAALGRFVSPDSIIPNPGNPISFDRFGYVRNNPLKYIDPSGHKNYCGWQGSQYDPEECGAADPNEPVPEIVNSELLSEWGQNMYWLYTQLFNETEGWWWREYGADGYFSIIDFLHLILSYEFGPLEGPDVDDQFLDDLQEAGARGFWCSPVNLGDGCAHPSSFSGEAILNWMGNGLGSAKMRYDQVADGASVLASFTNNQRNPGIATSVIDAISNPRAEWKSFDQNRPLYWGNYSIYNNQDILSAQEGYLNTNVVQKWGVGSGNPFFILTSCQSAYWHGDNHYLSLFCP